MALADFTYRLKALSGDTTPHDEKAVSGDLSGGTITLVDRGSGDYVWQFVGIASVAIPNRTTDPTTTGGGMTFAIRMAIHTYTGGGFNGAMALASASGVEKTGLFLGQNGTNSIRAQSTMGATDNLVLGTLGTSIRTFIVRFSTAGGVTDKVSVWLDGTSGDSPDLVSAGQNATAYTVSHLNIGSAGVNTIHVADLVFWPEELSDANCRTLANSGIRATLDVDTTAPALTSPTGTQTGSSTATIGATTDEANGTMYGVVTVSGTAPSVAQIQAGQDNSGAAAAYASSQSITTTGAKTFSATGLAASTAYYAHIQHKDAAANDSTVVTSAQFTTAAGAGSALAKIIQQMGL